MSNECIPLDSATYHLKIWVYISKYFPSLYKLQTLIVTPELKSKGICSPRQDNNGWGWIGDGVRILTTFFNKQATPLHIKWKVQNTAETNLQKITRITTAMANYSPLIRTVRLHCSSHVLNNNTTATSEDKEAGNLTHQETAAPQTHSCVRDDLLICFPFPFDHTNKASDGATRSRKSIFKHLNVCTLFHWL